jgi:hypothetical protein
MGEIMVIGDLKKVTGLYQAVRKTAYGDSQMIKQRNKNLMNLL